MFQQVTKTFTLFIVFLFVSIFISAKEPKGNEWITKAITRSQDQLLSAAEKYKSSNLSPRTLENGKIEFVGFKDWTCGFFSG